MYSDQYETPDVARENYESCREEERETNEDRMTVAEGKEIEAEDEAQEEERNNVALDHANDERI